MSLDAATSALGFVVPLRSPPPAPTSVAAYTAEGSLATAAGAATACASRWKLPMSDAMTSAERRERMTVER